MPLSATATEISFKAERVRSVVRVHVTIRQEQRTRALPIPGHEQLGDFASRIVRDDVGGFDSQRIEKFREHLRLSRWTNFVILSGFGVTQSHEIRGDASPVSREAGYDTAPLEAVEPGTRAGRALPDHGTFRAERIAGAFDSDLHPSSLPRHQMARSSHSARSQNRETSELREKLSSIDHIT